MRAKRREMRTQQIRVRGRVQGVGFREALRAEALRLGVSGWVRNRADGSVEALLQGDDPAVDRLIAWARRGPPLAQVHTVDVSAAELGREQTYQSFERRPSA
jgi:acylphosphatase